MENEKNSPLDRRAERVVKKSLEAKIIAENRMLITAGVVLFLVLLSLIWMIMPSAQTTTEHNVTPATCIPNNYYTGTWQENNFWGWCLGQVNVQWNWEDNNGAGQFVLNENTYFHNWANHPWWSSASITGTSISQGVYALNSATSYQITTASGTIILNIVQVTGNPNEVGVQAYILGQSSSIAYYYLPVEIDD